MNNKIVIWTLAFIILAHTTFALGMMPAYNTVFYEPNSRSTNSFTILNSGQDKLGIELYVEGDIKKYVSLHETSTIIEGPDKTISYTVNMPDRLKPGVHTGYIVVEEFEPEAKGETHISAKLKLKHRVQVMSPYPEKYLDASLETREFQDYFDIVIKLFNLGNSSINTVYAESTIFEGDKKIQTITSSKQNLPQNAKDEILIRLGRNSVKNGVYQIISDITYDGKKTAVESPITIGKPHIKILNYTQSFELGEINKFEVLLENEWNREIKDIYIDFYVFKDNREITKIKTPSFNLRGYEVKDISVYWKTQIEELGTYDAILILNYEGRSEETVFTIELVEAEINKWIVITLTAIIVGAGAAMIYFLLRPKPKELPNVRQIAAFMHRELRKGRKLEKIIEELVESGWSKKHVKLARKLLRKRR